MSASQPEIIFRVAPSSPLPPPFRHDRTQGLLEMVERRRVNQGMAEALARQHGATGCACTVRPLVERPFLVRGRHRLPTSRSGRPRSGVSRKACQGTNSEAGERHGSMAVASPWRVDDQVGRMDDISGHFRSRNVTPFPPEPIRVTRCDPPRRSPTRTRTARYVPARSTGSARQATHQAAGQAGVEAPSSRAAPRFGVTRSLTSCKSA